MDPQVLELNQSMNDGKVIDVKKQQVTILDENGTEITFSKLKDIQVKKFQKIIKYFMVFLNKKYEKE